jgi:hypothetical protein
VGTLESLTAAELPGFHPEMFEKTGATRRDRTGDLLITNLTVTCFQWLSTFRHLHHFPILSTTYGFSLFLSLLSVSIGVTVKTTVKLLSACNGGFRLDFQRGY